jgi:hypothetical protein
MANVQLSSRESVRVFIETGTKRILGFAPENARMLGAPGFRYTSEVLNHARDIERYVAKYREQQDRDAHEKVLLKVQRESRFRKALRSAIEARNQHVNPLNRDLNNTFLRLMDEKYDRMIQTMLHPVVHGAAEAYEQSATAHEVALDSPYFSHGPERVAGGDRVSPDEAS